MTRILSLVEFAAELERLGALDATNREIIEAGCKMIRFEARRVIGSYDAKPTWPQLAESTQRNREKKGFPANEPLLRTGDLRDSIEYQVISDHEGNVGSNLDIAVYQELGTSKMPPRPFLSTSAKKMGPEIAKMAGRATAARIAGQGFGEIQELLHLAHGIYEAGKNAVEPLLTNDDDER